MRSLCPAAAHPVIAVRRARETRRPSLGSATRRVVSFACMMAAAAPAAAAQVSAVHFQCNGQPITDIRITTRPAFDENGERWWERFASRTANSLHTTTRASVVRRFLLMQVGEPCHERAIAESERILRAQPFIAAASVNAEVDSGGVTLNVETRDEYTPILGGSASSSSPYIDGVKLGEGNLFGSATRVVAEWREGDERPTYAGRLIDYQFLGRPWILDLTAAQRDESRHDLILDLSHPFLTDQQRIAWRVLVGDEQELFEFYRGAEEPVDLGVESRYLSVGGILRVGVPGRLSLFGLSVSRERGRGLLLPTRDSTVLDAPGYLDLVGHFRPRENARLNALWGVRNIYYQRVERFDAVRAAQDVRVGFQLGTVLGRSIAAFGGDDDDILVAADVYLGMGGPRTFLSLDALGEGRHDYDTKRWDNILGSAHLALYHRVARKHTLVANVDWGGGWKRSIPFQLRLGDRDGGIRGYRDSRDAGGRRAVVRLEDRWLLGSLGRQADLGLVLFADAGWLRAGDVPFGVNTPTKYSVGIGLLGAFPSGSQRTWRVDLAYPLSADARAGRQLELRVTHMNARRSASWREPRDLRRSRERSLPATIFEWP